MVKGRKPNTTQGHLASLQNMNHVNGMRWPALKEKIKKKLLNGARNPENLKEPENHGVVTIE